MATETPVAVGFRYRLLDLVQSVGILVITGWENQLPENREHRTKFET